MPEQLLATLNEKFSELKIPDYIAPISCSDLTFGVKPPLIQLLDVAKIPDEIKQKLYDLAPRACFCVVLSGALGCRMQRREGIFRG